jgi:hypothetical protein
VNLINLELKRNYYFNIVIIIIFGFLLRIYGFSTNGYWGDEWYTLFFSNPNNTFAEFKFNLSPKGSGLPTYENTPWLFYIILKIIFSIFGYYAEIGRIFILLFAIGSIYLSFNIIKKYTKNKKIILSLLILVASNPFLVLESQETRVQSIVLFFGLLNLNEFLKLIEQVNLKNRITFIISMFLALSFSPVTLALFVSYIIYVLVNFYKKKNIYNFIKIFTISILIYIFFNYEYLSNVFFAKQFQEINLKFFFSFFFSSFFGTSFFGGFLLLFLIISTIINFNKIIYDKKILLIYIIITTTYLLLIIKSINSNLLVPRYIIFIVPLILILVLKNIEKLIFIKKKNKFYLISLIIFFSLIITFYKINNRPIIKPPTNDLIVSISRSQVKTITSESFLFGNYLKTHYLFKKNNLKFLDYEDINNINSSVWFICTNNMRANTSLENLQDYRFVKCSSNKLEIKMKIIEEINIPDFQARLYAKK